MTEEKVRSAKQALFIVVKVISIFIAGFLSMAIVTTAACISSVEYKLPDDVISAEDSYEIVQQDADQTKTESQESALSEHQSTMSRMITGKETAKGDRAAKLEKKLILQRKKKLARKKEIKKLYSAYNLELMAHLINGEAGDQNDECQQVVGMVVVNRVFDESFKQNTIKDVIFSEGQYACTDSKKSGYYKEPSKQVWKNAKAVLTGRTIINVPRNVVFQSQFAQGSKIWKKIGTEIFCCK
mgnify:CR=1 FL=1